MRIEFLGLALTLSELALLLRRRGSRSGARSRDAGTLGLAWAGIALGAAAGASVFAQVELGRFSRGNWTGPVALLLFLGGIALRWWSILTLGRFFTVDVVVHEGHELVTRGPYRHLRHPSYTGLLIALLGLGLALCHWLALAAFLAPIVVVLVVRIRVEEQALAERFGDAWGEHRARTWCLIPFLW